MSLETVGGHPAREEAQLRKGIGSLDWCRHSGGGSLGGMSNHIYKKIELVGSSPDSIEDAVKNALAKASSSLRNIRWFEVVETRGHVEDGKIGHWQVTIKVGFTLDG